MGEVKLLHTAMRLAAEHRAALEQVVPLVRLAEKFFQGHADEAAVKEAIQAELSTLAIHHGRLSTFLSAMRGVLSATPAPPAPPMDRRGD